MSTQTRAAIIYTAVFLVALMSLFAGRQGSWPIIAILTVAGGLGSLFLMEYLPDGDASNEPHAQPTETTQPSPPPAEQQHPTAEATRRQPTETTQPSPPPAEQQHPTAEATQPPSQQELPGYVSPGGQPAAFGSIPKSPAAFTWPASSEQTADDPKEGSSRPKVLGEGSRVKAKMKPVSAAAIAAANNFLRPATSIDSYSLDHYEIRASSRLGIAHGHKGEPRQDSYSVSTAKNGDYLVAVIADGVGSADFSHFGSHWVTRLLPAAVDAAVHEERNLDWQGLFERTKSDLTTKFNSSFPDGTDIRMIQTTVVLLIASIDGKRAWVTRIGDSDLFRLTDGRWESVFGGAAETPIASSSTAAFPSTSAPSRIVPIETRPGDCLLMVTDGVGDPLESSSSIVGAHFASLLEKPIDEFEFASLVAFQRKGANDDRTAIAIWPK